MTQRLLLCAGLRRRNQRDGWATCVVLHWNWYFLRNMWRHDLLRLQHSRCQYLNIDQQRLVEHI
jgi:hypothetical protein